MVRLVRALSTAPELNMRRHDQKNLSTLFDPVRGPQRQDEQFRTRIQIKPKNPVRTLWIKPFDTGL